MTLTDLTDEQRTWVATSQHPRARDVRRLGGMLMHRVGGVSELLDATIAGIKRDWPIERSDEGSGD